MKNRNSILIIGQISFVVGIVLIFLARNSNNIVYLPAGILLGLSIVLNTYSAAKRYFNK